MENTLNSEKSLKIDLSPPIMDLSRESGEEKNISRCCPFKIVHSTGSMKK
jgi:hypothetical protein